MLLDAQATKANVMAASQKHGGLGQGLRSGLPYLGLFRNQSHGTQVADKNGDEADGLDEAVCFHDIAEKGGDWDPATIGIDDEFHDLFDLLAHQ